MKKINKKADKLTSILVSIIIAGLLVILVTSIMTNYFKKGSDNLDNFFKCENNIMYSGGEIETACMLAKDCKGEWLPYIDNVEEAQKAGCQGERICCMNLP